MLYKNFHLYIFFSREIQLHQETFSYNTVSFISEWILKWDRFFWYSMVRYVLYFILFFPNLHLYLIVLIFPVLFLLRSILWAENFFLIILKKSYLYQVNVNRSSFDKLVMNSSLNHNLIAGEIFIYFVVYLLFLNRLLGY